MKTRFVMVGKADPGQHCLPAEEKTLVGRCELFNTSGDELQGSSKPSKICDTKSVLQGRIGTKVCMRIHQTGRVGDRTKAIGLGDLCFPSLA